MAAIPSLKQLQYLVALADHRHFTRAAESCFVTQSTLSAGLKELESLLGAHLVERNRQHVLMTPLGEEIARRARELLTGAQDIARLAEEAVLPMCGQIRFGIIPTIAPFILPEFVARLRAQHPKLQLALREDKTHELLLRLEDGRLDFALIALPYETDRLRIAPLFGDPLWLVGRHDDPALAGKMIALNEELIARLLLLEEGHCLREHALAACSREGGQRPGSLEATSLLTLVQMVESGLGLSLLPEMALKSHLMDRSELLARPLPAPSPERTIALAARSTTSRIAEFQAFADILRISRAEQKDFRTTRD